MWAVSAGARRFFLLLVLTAALIAGPAQWWTARYRFCINLAASVPGRVYLLRFSDAAPRRGELVAFRVPSSVDYPPGALFLKYVIGVPGDQVRHDPARRTWSVRGRPRGFVKRRDRRDAELRRGPEGLVPPGFYVLWAPHPDSYDSRYASIGWIPRTRIVGRGLLLF